MLASRQQKTQISLYRACKNNSLGRARSALDSGASVDLPDGTAGQNTALHIAAMFGSAHCIQLLAERGADLNLKNRRGRTALETARWVGEKEATAMLEALAEGGRVHLEGSGDDDDDDEQAAQLSLFSACQSNEVSKATDAILGGANLDAVDGSSTANRPVHVAALYGAVQVIELLHHYHADIGSLNGEGLTALDLARSADHTQAAALLEEILNGRRADAGGASFQSGTSLAAQHGGDALDGTVTFGEAPHPGEAPPLPQEVDVFGINGQPLPQFRSRGG